jgi:beta-phosphoglucomutase
MKLQHNGIQREVGAVLFDMDGVVTDTMPWHFKCWREIFLRKGIEVNRDDIYRREGEKGLVSIINLCREKGVEVSVEEGEHLLSEKEKIFQAEAKIQLFAGITEFIIELSNKGLIIGLVTGTSRREMEKLLPAELIEIFKAIVTGDMLEKGKPEPDPYLRAVKQTGLAKERIVVIENAPLGIQSAKAAGLFTIAIQTSLGEEYLKKADIIIKDHAGLYSIFSN